MMTQTSPLHGRLHRVEPDQARALNTVIAALNHREVEGLRTVSRAANERDRRAATAWIQFTTREGPVAVAPLLVDGQLARMTSRAGEPDGVAAAAALGQIETLVVAAETIFGVELHPAGLLADPPEDALLVCLDANDARGTIFHRVLIAVPPGIAVTPLPLPAQLPPVLGALRLKWQARIAAPIAPTAARLATLGEGDLVLLGLGPFVADLILPGRKTGARAVLDWQAHQLRLECGPHHGERRVNQPTELAEPNREDAAGGAGPEWGDLRIPLGIEFDGGGLSAADMATLGEGSVLPLPSQGGTLAVRIVAGDTAIADGELVAVGEGFGVLVTAVRNTQGG